MVVALLQAWTWVVVIIMVIYAFRHWRFTWNRISARQRPYYQDLIDSELPAVSVIVPMHNEAEVAKKVLEALINSSYPSTAAGASIVMVLPALVGMAIGQLVRHMLSPVLFKKVFFGSLILLGLHMIVREMLR